MSKLSVDPKKNIALYLQVKDILIHRIQNNIWAANTLIPTEQELMDEFNVSRTTIRQAISMLVQEGILEKKQGKGTIVKSQQLVGSLGKLRGFAEEAMEKGLTPHSKLLRSQFSETLFQEKAQLEVPEDEKIFLIERIRFADETPVAIERTCWPRSIGEVLNQCDLNKVNFYDILEKNNIFLKRASEKISALNATIQEADLLGIRPGEALLQMTKISFGLDDKPIEFAITKYRSDFYHYDIELKR
ncbi:GntR family transcriptional regulator [Scopulibacillus cellulosilyticus]|uniref:GntR family transcriptional regulator n=1 Tax=Scopulibacillus cellulosilyticus TaxID=2665665 RepID=A0ABW2PW14_9BACL